MRPFSALLLSLLAVSAFAVWTTPIKLLEGNRFMELQSEYRDPTSSFTHVVVSDYGGSRDWHWHLAVADNGTVVYKTLFNQTGGLGAATVRGAGDGRRLFLAISCTPGASYTINFTESADGGRTWSVPQSVFPYGDRKTGKNRRLQDMLYVKETGRLFLFYVNMERPSSIRVVSRAPGSSVFSSDALVQNWGDARYFARAAYSLRPEDPHRVTLHVAYRNYSGFCIVYTSSRSNGLSWTKPKVISGDEAPLFITHMFVNQAVSPNIYVVYTLLQPGKSARMVYSPDHGSSFAAPVPISKKVSRYDQVLGGIAVCRGEDGGFLESLLTMHDNTVEYARWDLAGTRPTFRVCPFSELRNVRSSIMDCFGEGAGVTTLGFVTATDDKTGALLFAKET